MSTIQKLVQTTQCSYLNSRERLLACMMRKLEEMPEPSAFHKTLVLLKRTPGEVLFIDDTFENVQGSRNVGIESIQFTGALNLRDNIRSMA